MPLNQQLRQMIHQNPWFDGLRQRVEAARAAARTLPITETCLANGTEYRILNLGGDHINIAAFVVTNTRCKLYFPAANMNVYGMYANQVRAACEDRLPPGPRFNIDNIVGPAGHDYPGFDVWVQNVQPEQRLHTAVELVRLVTCGMGF